MSGALRHGEPGRLPQAANDRLASAPDSRIFARKGEAIPLVDKQGGAEAPEEVVAIERSGLRVINVINERSPEAGYPDNPTPEEVVREEMALAATLPPSKTPPPVQESQNNAIDLGNALREHPSAMRTQDELLLKKAAPSPLASQTSCADACTQKIASPLAADRKAAVSFKMTARDYLRLRLGSAELQMSSEELINAAIEEYLDVRGVESLNSCQCLSAAADAIGAAITSQGLDT